MTKCECKDGCEHCQFTGYLNTEPLNLPEGFYIIKAENRLSRLIIDEHGNIITSLDN